MNLFLVGAVIIFHCDLGQQLARIDRTHRGGDHHSFFHVLSKIKVKCLTAATKAV
jgi:hypothetical protein